MLFRSGNVDGTFGVNKNSRIAILNTLNGNVQLPYVGLLAQGIPRLQVIQNKELEENIAAQDKQNAYVLGFVLANGEPVIIPNIDMVERVILDLSL